MTKIRMNYLKSNTKMIKEEKKAVVFFNNDTFEIINLRKLYDFLRTHSNVKHYAIA